MVFQHDGADESPPGIIDEAHAVLLARHLAELHKRRRFTDLKVHSPPSIIAAIPSDRLRWASIPYA